MGRAFHRESFYVCKKCFFSLSTAFYACAEIFLCSQAFQHHLARRSKMNTHVAWSCDECPSSSRRWCHFSRSSPEASTLCAASCKPPATAPWTCPHRRCPPTDTRRSAALRWVSGNSVEWWPVHVEHFDASTVGCRGWNCRGWGRLMGRRSVESAGAHGHGSGRSCSAIFACLRRKADREICLYWLIYWDVFYWEQISCRIGFICAILPGKKLTF